MRRHTPLCVRCRVPVPRYIYRAIYIERRANRRDGNVRIFCDRFHGAQTAKSPLFCCSACLVRRGASLPIADISCLRTSRPCPISRGRWNAVDPLVALTIGALDALLKSLKYSLVGMIDAPSHCNPLKKQALDPGSTVLVRIEGQDAISVRCLRRRRHGSRRTSCPPRQSMAWCFEPKPCRRLLCWTIERSGNGWLAARR